MKDSVKTKILLFAFIFSFSLSIKCQTYGKIFSKIEANQLFGAVPASVSVSVQDLQNYLNQTNNVLMFKIKDGNLIVLGDGRTLIYPSSATVIASDVFNVFSKSIIMQLINEGAQAFAQVEMRTSTLTITIGQFTLEQSLICPPFCP